MSTVELKHTWTVDRDSRILRFYLWLWDASPRDVTFCKLFWGYLFAPLWLLIGGFVLVGGAPVRGMVRRIRASAERYERERWAKPPRPPKPAKPPKEDMPSRIALFFARPGIRRGFRLLGLGTVALVGLNALGWAAYGIYLLAPYVGAWHWSAILGAAAMVLGGAVAGSIGALCLVWVCSLGAERWQPIERVKDRRARRRAAGKLTLRQLLWHGAKAVKSNTCPRIEIREGSEA